MSIGAHRTHGAVVCVMFNLGYMHALLDQPVPTHLNRHAPGMPQHMRHPATTPCLLASAGALQHPNPATRGAEHRQALVDQHSTSWWCSRAVAGRRRMRPAGARPWFDQGAHGLAAAALHPWQPGHLAAHIMLQGGFAGCWPHSRCLLLHMDSHPRTALVRLLASSAHMYAWHAHQG